MLPTASEQDRVPSAAPAPAYPDHLRLRVERYLESLRFAADAEAAGLEEAMRYSLLAGGKRQGIDAVAQRQALELPVLATPQHVAQP